MKGVRWGGPGPAPIGCGLPICSPALHASDGNHRTPTGILALAAVVVIALLFPAPAVAPTTVLPGCTVEPNMANAGGTRFDCKGSEWLGAVDYQCGVYVPGDRQKLNCNIGAGNHLTRGYVVLSPDVGKGTLLEDGHKRKLLLVRARRYGGTEFRTRVRFERGLTLCDRRGCFDVARMIRRLRHQR